MNDLTRNILLGLVIALVLLAVVASLPAGSSVEEVRYSTFLEDVRSGRVDSVVLQGDMIYGVRKDRTQFKAYNPETDYTALISVLIKAQVAIEGHPPRPGVLSQLQQSVPGLLALVVLVYAIAHVQHTVWGRDTLPADKARARRSVPALVLTAGTAAQRAAGSLPTVILEGGKAALIELQALVDPEVSGAPHHSAQGLDAERAAMLLAVLRRHSKLGLGGHDVFVGTVGATEVRDTGTDLPLVLALAGSHTGQTLPARLLAFGEIDLTGDVRPVAGAEERLKEAHRQGFVTAVVPRGNEPRKPLPGLTVIPVSRIEEAIRAAFAASTAAGNAPAG